jgi:hypothetical protein
MAVTSAPPYVLADTEPTEPPTTASVEEDATADFAGWRLCPTCGELNRPEASYCIRCGRDLNVGRDRTAPYLRPGITLEPRLGFVHSFTDLGPGFSFAAEGKRVREETAVLPVFYTDYGFGYESTFVASDTHVYLTTHELKPYVDLDVKLWVAGDVIFEFGPGAGVRYNYDRRGSFFYCTTGFNIRAFPGWDEYGPDDYEWNIHVTGKYHLTQYYAKHAGVTFAAQTFSGGAIITVGHAFLF